MTKTTPLGRSRAPGTAAKRPAPRKLPGASAKGAKKAPARTKKTLAAKGAVPATGSIENVARPRGKLVRDSFTIPKAEYQVLESLKVRAANLTRPVKKSELLRAGIAALKAMSDAAFLAALSGVPSLKTGRPKGTPTTPAAAKRAR